MTAASLSLACWYFHISRIADMQDMTWVKASRTSVEPVWKPALNSTGHSACTSEVRDTFDRQTHVPNDWLQRTCSRVIQPWDRRNSTTAPVRNITNLQGLICHKTKTNQKKLCTYLQYQYSKSHHINTLFTNPSARAGYDTRSIFKAKFNRFSFS